MIRHNHKIVAVFLVLVLSLPVFAGESIVLKYVKKWTNKLFPNVMEIAWVSNTVNAVYQVGSLARTTLALVNEYEESYKQLVKTKELIEKTFDDIEMLYKKFDPYNLDSWAATLQGAQRVIAYDCYPALVAWNNVNFIPATSKYVFRVDSIMTSFNYRHKENKKFVDSYYYDPNLDSLRLEYARLVGVYVDGTMENINKRIEILQQRRDTCSTDESCEEIRSEFNDLMDREQYFIDGLVGVAINHEDTLMNFIRDMVAFNLTEIQVFESKILEFELAADFLVEQFYDLKGAKASRMPPKESGTPDSTPVESAASPSDSMLDAHVYDKFDPNRIPAPPGATFTSSGQMIKFGETKKRFNFKTTPNLHDVLHLQNAVDYVQLQQEYVLRELAMLKAKSMAALVAAEAYDDNAVEMDVLVNMNKLLEALEDER